MKNQQRQGAAPRRATAPAQTGPVDGAVPGGPGPYRPGGRRDQPAERLPHNRPERRPALAALAVLLILGGALGTTALVLRAGDRMEAVRLTRTVEPGESVGRDDVAPVSVAPDEGVHYVRWEQLGALQGLQALSRVPAGAVVVGEMFGEKADVAQGKATVGLALKEGQFPAGLKAGDTVAVHRVGRTTGTSSLAESDDGDATATGDQLDPRAQVESVVSEKDERASDGGTSLTLLVDEAAAGRLASAASAGEVAVVRVPRD